MSPKEIMTEALERIQREHGVRVASMSVEWLSTATVTAPESAVVQSIAVSAYLVTPPEGRYAGH